MCEEEWQGAVLPLAVRYLKRGFFDVRLKVLPVGSKLQTVSARLLVKDQGG